jgi:phenylacetate-CoA ligase
MQRFLTRHVLLPFFEGVLKRRDTFRHWKALEESQWLGPDELASRQLDALRRLLAHAFESCPYYRETWLALGLRPRLRGLDDFRAWPVLDRDTVRAQRHRLRANVPGMRLLSKSTGGSSGVPLHFDLDFGSHDRRTAAMFRGYGWAGAAPGTKQLFLWGMPLGNRSRWKQWKDRCYDRLYRRRVINCFDLSEDRAEEFCRRLNHYRPDALVAYTGALDAFARMIEEQHLEPFAPKTIVVGAEKLHDFQRRRIERVFRAPVFETYGSREFMLIGSECPRHQGLHLTAEHLLVEVLDDDGRPAADGEEGNLVITDLFNYGMPFIRYATGDRAVAGWGRCSCGRGLPLLQKVIGRRLDVLHTPDGRRIPGEFFPHLMKDFAAVRRFQVVQAKPDRIEVRLVLAGRWGEQERKTLAGAIRETFGPAVRVDLRAVDDIPLTAAGKLRVVVNLCGTEDRTQPCASC